MPFWYVYGTPLENITAPGDTGDSVVKITWQFLEGPEHITTFN